MFAANALTAWVEAFRALYHDGAARPDDDPMRDIPIHTEYPMAEVDYPGLWINYSMQGDLKTVGIGHQEFHLDEQGSLRKVFRWHFGGVVEITIGAMSNLERALIFDELTRAIAVARVDENREGALREHIERNDLIGQIVTWDSITVTGFAESQGTPWGTDDVIYEVTVALTTSGEVAVSASTGVLVPLSAIIVHESIDGSGVTLPTPGVDGWI